MDFHEQQIKEIIDFGVSNHRKSMKKHLLRPEITPRPLGVGKQTRYLGLLASRACSSFTDKTKHTVSGTTLRLAAEMEFSEVSEVGPNTKNTTKTLVFGDM